MSQLTNKQDELSTIVHKYVLSVIIGFESGIYKMILQTERAKIKYLASEYHPFITIFRDLHEKYYTDTFNAILNNNTLVRQQFDNIKKISNHSYKCLLNILANLTVSVHFNIDRTKLKFKNRDEYLTSVKNEIHSILSLINIFKLFDHICTDTDTDIKLINEGKFIEIELSHNSNGVIKKINSFTINNNETEEPNEKID